MTSISAEDLVKWTDVFLKLVTVLGVPVAAVIKLFRDAGGTDEQALELLGKWAALQTSVADRIAVLKAGIAVVVDERLYRERLCYVCQEFVPHTRGVRCRVSETCHFYLCDKCNTRVRRQFRSPARRHLDRLLPALRAMRTTSGGVV